MTEHFRNAFIIITMIVLMIAFLTAGGLAFLVTIGWIIGGAMALGFIATIVYVSGIAFWQQRKGKPDPEFYDEHGRRL